VQLTFSRATWAFAAASSASFAAFAFAIAGTALEGQVDLGALRGHGATIPSALAASAKDALMFGFHIAFGVCGLVTLMAAGVAAVMKDLPLRSGPR
jgi:hypothetical protein